jgi:hypothetical protein
MRRMGRSGWTVSERRNRSAGISSHSEGAVILPKFKDAPELPPFFRQTLWVDMRDWEREKNDGFYSLVCGILGRTPGDSPARQ